jgi:hypothetical protein
MQIFGTRFWGFGPAEYPFAGFTYPGSRDSLIARSRPGDLLLILGTKGEETAKEDRGQLLGLIEFERTAAFADDFILDGQIPANLLDENGKFRWPYAVPAIRAWEFTPPRDIWSVLRRQLTMAATTSVDQLTPEEVELVLALPKAEISLPPSRARTRADRVAANRIVQLDKNAPGQPGPAPAEWSALVAHEDGPTATYVMRFGKRNVWKIGISKNPKQRLNALNFSVPVEVLSEEWALHVVQKWENGMLAYEMEQALLRKLAPHCTKCERVSCDQKTIEGAWNAYVAATG